MGIIIGADIVPTDSNAELFVNGQVEKLIGSELLNMISEADYSILNLEVPLANHKNPIIKEGPNLISFPMSINGIKAMGIDLLSLANNHIMDQGDQGLISTIDVLDKAGIMHVGAGFDLQEAQKSFYFTIKGKKYGIYACAEHEFSIAKENKPGANPFDPLESLDHIEQMKTKCDYAIVLYHGGKEHYRYPSPLLQKICRKIIEKGANIVVCQHSHCIGCKEEYKGGVIVYGQGNFLFDDLNNEYWNTSLLIEITEEDEIRFIPLIKHENGVRLAMGDKAQKILLEFNLRGEEILKPNVIEEKYADFAQRNYENYMLCFLGIKNNMLFRIINKISGHHLQRKVAKKYKKIVGLELKNYIECEAHRELVLKGLE